MKQLTADLTEPAAERSTCTVCPLLCEDIFTTPTAAHGACDHGRVAILADVAEADTPRPEACENGIPVPREQAFRRAAAMLTAARRVLVTGLADATLEAVTAGCDLAEMLGAAVDAGQPESSRAAGPTIARAGEVTAAWEELRDRADLVIFWCCDPAVSHPRFLERFVEPTLADGRTRLSIAVGHAPVMPMASPHRHLPLADELAVEAARCLHMRLAGRREPAGLAGPLVAVCDTLHEAIAGAACVAIVTQDSADPIGLEAWSIVHLVRVIAHEKPAFLAPLGTGLAAGGGNASGAAAACTWRYGAPGAIDRADRMGSRFLPGESAARRLIDRGEVDAVLVLGRPSGPLEKAIVGRGDTLSLVRICDGAGTDAATTGRSVHFRCASRIATIGTMLREDGRRVVLRPSRKPAAPQMTDLLVGLAGALREAVAPAHTGGRP